MSFYENLGFTNHPFSHTNADEEPFLQDYFVAPPFFDGVVGDAGQPNSCFVLAPRGGGKSAQRRMIEQWSLENGVLGVTYDRFEFSVGQTVDDVGLPYHMRNIIIRILISYLSFLANDPNLLTKLDRSKRESISHYAHVYLGEMTGDSLYEILGELKSIPDRIKEFWHKNVGILEPIINVLLKKYGLESIDLPDVIQEEKKLSASYKHQLEIIRDLCREIGIRSIYVLIDKVDETEETGNEPNKTYLLIRPLVRDLELLGLEGYGFKFFLWDQIEPFFREDARPDRVAQYQLKWSRQALETVLNKRLLAFSDGRINTFLELMSKDPGYSPDSVLSILANGSPRNLIRFCRRIFDVQAEMDPSSKSISPEAIDQASIIHSDQIAAELYGREISKSLQRVGRELFTINFLANEVFKTSHVNTSRNKVTEWQKTGVVVQIGTVSIPQSRRPVNLYYVSDPSMNRLINRDVSLRSFIQDRWITCDSCSADNLMDISLIPPGNDLICFECHRPLF
jgi:hypothetical protein